MLTASALPTILVVDNDRISRTMLAELLQDDCRVLMARDGLTAFEILAREAVDLVLLDLFMPEMDGFEVITRIRATEGLEDLAVICITALSLDADEERALLLGASDFVHKPVRPALLRARVMTHLKLTSQQRALTEISSRDGLTGLTSRRSFDLDLAARLARPCRRDEELAIALFDIDHFKLYNEHYGHSAGDEALRQVALILQNTARRSGDIAARYDGEKFVLVLSGKGDFDAMLTRVAETVAGAAIPHEASPTSPVLTISGGGLVHVIPPCDPADLMAQVSEMLSRAREAGRNRVLLRPPEIALPEWNRIL
ncbi:diguanylate cyclase domain-containing protein [Pseudogemmobacter faecipullorum]|uniref:diguanylate cyclase n=1 Tax=Pseudogemmobacter faecipullorum TaxID=2755041 RepID=A0ABS8CL09_9RHOB|nr:diguanylate cyclase [Pseudogemmobacter faecipullorum]MCB5409535.1 diguanylate cyclase [Pseudogemmobacter faecipullorum]